MKMSKIILIVVVALGAVLFISARKANNVCNAYEQSIKAADEVFGIQRNKAVQTITGKNAVLKKYTTFFEEALTAENVARYGEQGSQAGMQWIQEDNREIPTEVFTELSDYLEIAWSDIGSASMAQVDKVRSYRQYLGDWNSILPNSVYASIAGYPSIDLDTYGKAVVSKGTRDVMETREETGISIEG